MAMVSMQPRPMDPSRALLGAHGSALLDEAGAAAGVSAVRSDRRSIEEQRERAQREFKRIWNLCALPQ